MGQRGGERLPEEKKVILCYIPDMEDTYSEKDMYFDLAILLEGSFVNLDAEEIHPSHWMSIPIPQMNTSKEFFNETKEENNG